MSHRGKDDGAQMPRSLRPPHFDKFGSFDEGASKIKSFTIRLPYDLPCGFRSAVEPRASSSSIRRFPFTRRSKTHACPAAHFGAMGERVPVRTGSIIAFHLPSQGWLIPGASR